MAVDPQIWRFTQLGGDGTVLTLGGWQAPFGRPRAGSLVNAGVSIRQTTTYYPGSVEPTTHSFGTMPEPWELHGRWMDQAIGRVGGAQAMRRKWFDFVAAQQMVRAAWGDILSYRIFIEKIDLHFESQAEVAWALKAIVHADESSPTAPTTPNVRTPLDIASALQSYWAKTSAPYLAPAFGNVLSLLPEISDAIDDLITATNTPFGQVYQVASALTDFETALSSDLGKIGAGLQTMKTGVINLRYATDNLVAQATALTQGAPSTPYGMFSGADMLALTATKASADANAANLLALIASMQAQIDATTRGTQASAVQAGMTDSWESIAIRTLGGADGARAIRDMNGIRFGARPVPGKTYTIPQGT